MPRHFSERERENIKELLLEVGLEQFEKYGYSKTSVSDIVEKVGIAKGSFYNFYETKSDLFLEVYFRERKKVNAEFVEILKSDVISDSSSLVKAYSEHLNESRKISPILNIIYDNESLSAITEKSIRDKLIEYNNDANEEISDAIGKWLISNEVNCNVDIRILTAIIRSISFFEFHKDAIGEELFAGTINTILEAVSAYCIDDSKKV